MVQRERARRRLVALSRQKGSTLIETIFCVAIIVVMLAALGAYSLGRNAYAVHAAAGTFAALVADARAVAQTSGSGATIAIARDANGGFIATLYPYRPLPGADLTAPPVRTLGANVALAPLAIFISSSGTASAAAWTPESGTLSAEPACTDAISLTFSDGFASETHAIPCAQAQLQ